MTLPALLIWSGSALEWDSYIDGVYNCFMSSFVRANHIFLNKPVRARWHPPHDNKHFCFWHLVSEKGISDSEGDRLPVLSRCERIAWIGYILANISDTARIWCWCNERVGKRGREKRYLLYLHASRYLVILAEKPDCFHLVTAYTVERNHTHEKLVKERDLSDDPRES